MKTIGRKIAAAGMVAALALAVVEPGWAAESSAPEMVSLVQNVQVKDEYVHLGDLFENAGKYSDRVIARAPRPGETVTLSARWLWKLAQSYGLDWKPASTLDVTSVTRESTLISMDTQKQAIERAVRKAVPFDGELAVTIDVPLNDVHIAPEIAPKVEVSGLHLDSRDGTFTAIISVPAGSGAAFREAVAGRVQRLIDVPVPVKRLSPGTVISEGDIEMIRVKESELSRNMVTDEGQLIGQSAKRTLIAGQPVALGSVEPPVLVQRNGLVTVVLKSGAMLLTAQAKAIEDGAQGEVIRVKNTQSDRVIEAVVTGLNRVEVILPQKIALN